MASPCINTTLRCQATQPVTYLEDGISMRKTGSESLKMFLLWMVAKGGGRYATTSKMKMPDVLPDASHPFINEHYILDVHCVPRSMPVSGGARLVLFTTLRDPFDRTHSECHFSGPCAAGMNETIATYAWWHSSRATFKISAGHRFAVDPLCRILGGRYVDNYHVRRLAGSDCVQTNCSAGSACVEASPDPQRCIAERKLTRDDLERAKLALSAFHAVIVTDLMDDAFRWLSRCLLHCELDGEAVFHNKVNTTVVADSSKYNPIAPELQEWVRARNALDLELVDWARRRLVALLSTSGTSLPYWCDRRHLARE